MSLQLYVGLFTYIFIMIFSGNGHISSIAVSVFSCSFFKSRGSLGPAQLCLQAPLRFFYSLGSSSDKGVHKLSLCFSFLLHASQPKANCISNQSPATSLSAVEFISTWSQGQHSWGVISLSRQLSVSASAISAHKQEERRS